MAITPVTTDMAIIAALADLPNATSGITAAQLKAKYDEGGTALKTWINNTLIPALTSTTPGSSGAENISSAPITGLTGATPFAQLSDLLTKVLTLANTTAYTPTADYHPSTRKYVNDTVAGVVLGQVPDGSITTAKLADGTVTDPKLSRDIRIKRLYKVVWL